MKPLDGSGPMSMKFQMIWWGVALAVALVLGGGTAWGEGSRDLIESGGNRPWLEYQDGVTAGIQRQNTIKAYARENETLLLGSSAIGVGQGDIQWVAPDGAAGQCGADGRIADDAEEGNGPFPGAGGFDPCVVPVGPGQTGVWEIEFLSGNPTEADNPPPLAASDPWDTDDQSDGAGNPHHSVIAWDVTVLDAGGAPVDGRVFANKLALIMGDFNVPLSADVRVLTRDGYDYRVNLNGQEPFGFIFFANSVGFQDAATGERLFQSVDISSGLPADVIIQNPDTADEATHKIFFNPPAADLPETAPVSGGDTWLATPVAVLAPPEDLAFAGRDGTPNQTATGAGGTFRFTAPQAGTYSFLMDVNRDGDFNDPEDLILIGSAAPGDNTIEWDGRDGAGNVVPAGDVPFNVQVNLSAGEVHFPFFDVENNPSGFVLERLNGPSAPDTTIFYDDTPIGGNLALPPNGEDSAAGGHAFTGDFGDQRGIDTWTWVPSDVVAVDGGILIAEAALSVTKTPSSAAPETGDEVTYDIEVTNGGPTGVVGVPVTDSLPAGLADASWTCEPAADCAPASGNGNVDVELALDAGGSVAIALSATVTGPAGAPIENTATVGVPPDVADPDIGDNTASAAIVPVEPPPAPALSAAKRDELTGDVNNDGRAGAGDTLTHTVEIFNAGNAAADNVTFLDAPGANLTLVDNSVTASRGTVVSAAGTVEVAIASLAAGAAATITFQVRIADPLPDGVTSVQNQGTVSADGVDPVDTDDPDTGTAGDPTRTPVVAPQPGLSVAKRDALTDDADSDGFAGPGDLLTYTVVVASTGAADAENVGFADTPGANLALVTGSVATDVGAVRTGNADGDADVAVEVGSLAPDQRATITFDARIAPDLPADVRRVVNQGTARADGLADVPSDDPDTGEAGDPTVTPLILQPRLELIKRDRLPDADPDGVAGPGDTLRYTLVLRNTGNEDADGVELVDDPDPSVVLQTGTARATPDRPVTLGNADGDTRVRVDVGTLAAGESLEISFDVQIVTPLPDGVESVRNQARVTSAALPVRFSDDPDTAAPDDPTVTPVVARPILLTTKTDRLVDADGNGVANAGEIIRYEIRVENNGNASATGIRIADAPHPATALVAGSVVGGPGVAVRTGNDPADARVAADVGILPAGASASLDFEVAVRAPIPAGTTRIANQAAVGGDGLPERPTDDPDTLEPDDPTVTPVPRRPALSATKTDVLETDPDGDGAAGPGSVLRYLVTVTNAGNRPATDVVFRDRPDPRTRLLNGTVRACLSPGTVLSGNGDGDAEIEVDVGTIPPGEIRTICFEVEIVDPLPPGIREVANQGAVLSAELPALLTDDPDTLAGGDPTETPVVVRPLLKAAKSAVLIDDRNGDGAVNPGDALLYEIRLFNNGTGPATSVVYDDAPDPGAPLVAGTVVADPGAVVLGDEAGDGAVRVDIGTLPAGASARIAYRARVADPLPPGENRLENQGFLSSAELPPVPTDDPSTPTPDDPTVLPVVARPLLRAVKVDTLLEAPPDGDGAAGPGDPLLYTVEIVNAGTGAATGLIFSDEMPAETTLVAGTVQTDGGEVRAGNGNGDAAVVVSVPALPADSALRISWQVRMTDPLPDGLTEIANQGTVRAEGVDDVLTDDPDTVAGGDPTRTPVAPAPRLVATKSATLWDDGDGDGRAGPGERLLTTLVLQNRGSGTAPAVEITDDLADPHLSLVPGTVQADGGDVALGNGPADEALRVEIGDLAAGTAVRVSFQVRIADPLPADVGTVANQAVARDGDGNETPTDDPGSPAPGDPTVTPVGGSPALAAEKTAALVRDDDGDGFAGAGDRILYTVRIRNEGAATAGGVRFQDAPDANTVLAAGSVAVDPAGTVQVGNVEGDDRIDAIVGDLAAGAAATVTFEVAVRSPLPGGASAIANQGTVSGDGLPAIPTDDPVPPGEADPTVVPTPPVDPGAPPPPDPPAPPAPQLTTRKTAALDEDRDGDGVASPGDRLVYTVTLQNRGDGAAAGVRFDDPLGAYTTLETGSVATTRGTVTRGNAEGDDAVSVTVGILPPRSEAVVAFAAAVADPLPAGVNQVANQGLTTSGDAEQPSDDPDTPEPGDPTVLPISAAPAVGVEKAAALIADADGDGLVGPGDRLLYTITVVNDGNAAAPAVTFTDTPDPNTALVPGTVVVDQGEVLSGNGEGDSAVSVAIGTVPGGEEVVVSFEAAVADPLSAGVTSVANQGVAAGPDIPTTPSDDPDTPAPGDPTVTPIRLSPLVGVVKTDGAVSDDNGDGKLNPGERVFYEIRIENRGGGAALGLVLRDPMNGGAALAGGSAATDRGVVISGNRPGDAELVVEIGDLPPGGVATITFQAVAEDPGPEGGEVRNQAVTAGANVPETVSDDPDTPEPADPTRRPVAPLVRPDLAPPHGAKQVHGDCPVLTWEMRWTNDRNDAPLAVRVVDPVPAGTEFLPGTLSASGGAALFDPTMNRVEWEGVLAPGEDVLIRFQTAVPEGIGRVENQGCAFWDAGGDGSPADDAMAGQAPVCSDDVATPASNDPAVWVEPAPACPECRPNGFHLKPF